MYSSQLENDFLHDFTNADEAWVAVGLLSTSGINYIDQFKGSLHLLVGIDLPTPPSVLRDMMERNKKSKIHFRVHANNETFFHPKLYVIRRGNKYRAAIGSGNFTMGGWKDNIEIFWQVDKEQECKQLIAWFEIYMNVALLIDEAFIIDYEDNVFRPQEIENNQHRRRLNSFKGVYEADYQQFFRLEDFEAFAEEKTKSEGELAKAERKGVWDKLYELHERLYHEIQEAGWELYPNERKQDRVSRYWHGPFVSKVLAGIWLYYGKSPEELIAAHEQFGSETSPNDHVRLQIIVRNDKVGIWCAVGKGGGSIADRRNFNRKIQNFDEINTFFRLIRDLGMEYFIDVGGHDDIYVRDILTAERLYDIVNADIINLDKYFIIGMDVQPNDLRLRDDQIIPFIMQEFAKLYPIFMFIKTV